MRSRAGYLLAILVFLMACNKDKFQTKPSLTLKSLSSNVVPINGFLNIDLEFTDKEGDISDSIFVKKIRTNLLKTATVRDTFWLTVPTFPSEQKGIIQLRLTYDDYLTSAINPPRTGNPPTIQHDSLIIKIALLDKARNVSDTVTTGPVVILRQ